jgi:hypothetical protein
MLNNVYMKKQLLNYQQKEKTQDSIYQMEQSNGIHIL